MCMAMIETMSPEMVRREVLMHMIAYNAIRLLMLKAGKACGVSHRRISFKGMIQVIEESRVGFEKASGKTHQKEKDNLLRRIAERVVIERPGRRSEDRKVTDGYKNPGTAISSISEMKTRLEKSSMKPSKLKLHLRNKSKVLMENDFH
jgi:hypothetical protein